MIHSNRKIKTREIEIMSKLRTPFVVTITIILFGVVRSKSRDGSSDGRTEKSKLGARTDGQPHDSPDKIQSFFLFILNYLFTFYSV